MTHHLRSCTTCERHIRISEAACPFCGTAVPAERRTPPARGNPAMRLRRAATLATIASAGAVGAVDLAACSSSPDVVTAGDAYGAAQQDDATPDDVLTGGEAYGAAPQDDAAPDDAPDVVVTGGEAYGVAPQDASDASPDVVVTGGDAYGVAPQEAGDAEPVDGSGG